MTEPTATSALTAEEIKSVELTVERRNKLFEALKEANIARLAQLGKLIKEKERVAANSKALSRKKGKAAKKARKRNR